MGQTLTHGIYLPDEGERNCYNGLAANWQLLDGAVGTVAEHTSQIAGKAPAVHTHTKSNITDFPAYGNAAGTICEGNDSRLSDARTPVAHTHSKADVTDLLNSNFIPSANNTYDLGSSAYQWNNLYAKNYYYNGVAWGLDKENHWTNNNTFDTTIRVKSLTQEIGVTPSASKYTYCDFRDKNDISIGQVITGQFSNGYDTISLNMYNKYTNGVKDPNGTSVNAKFEVGLTPAGNPYLNANGKWLCGLTPIVANLNLGTSTNKWESLNGVNPGALSLPTTDTSKLTYFSGDITDLTGGLNSKSFAADGWVTILMPNVSGDFIAIDTSIGQVISVSGTGVGDANIACICPVRAGITNRIYCKCSSSLSAAAHIPCAGNV